MITLTDLSKQAHINPATLRRWCQTGKLPAQKYGKTWLVDETAVNYLPKRDTRGRQRMNIETLQDLTGHESGAVQYEDGSIWIGNLAQIQGIPREFSILGSLGLGEDLSGARRTATPAEVKAAMRGHEREQGTPPSYAGYRAWKVADVVVVVQSGWN